MVFNCSLDIFLYFLLFYYYFLIEAKTNAVSWLNLYIIANNIDYTLFS